MRHFWLVADILGGALFSCLIALVALYLTFNEECLKATERWRG